MDRNDSRLIISVMLLMSLYYYCYNADIVGSETTKKNSIYLNFDKFDNINVTNNINDIGTARLSIRILPITGCSIYITFPDGGNMLINTGNINDSEEINRILITEIGKAGTSYSFMKVLGWKPRIDWIIFTSSGQNYAGGLYKILDKIEVKQIIVPKGMNIAVPKETMLVELTENNEIDLMQVISKVKLVTLERIKIQNNAFQYLTLKLTYLNFNIVFLLNEFSNELLDKYGKSIKNTIIFIDNMSISKVVDPTIVIPVTEKITFITDGIKFYLDNITNELRNEIKKQQINKMYKEAKDNYSKERYKSVLRITEDILAIDSENKPVRILNMLARTNMLYTNKKYDEAKNEVSKLLEIDPDNKEANILLLRIDNIMRMMPGR